ncbi:MAG: TonB-dependent receptor, partial [Aquincola sp.]|nr:TonB-dependent receptor [Aquincola sp.]
GYRDSAVRAQWLLEPSRGLSVLANVHARDYDGSARLFRANIIEPGSNGFVSGFDEKKISIDGKNESGVQNYGANLRVRFALAPTLSLNSITGYEQVKTFSRGDIDGGFGASFLPPGLFGPGVIPFASETADGMPKHSQWTQEFRLESDTKTTLDWQAGVFLFKEDYKVESFSYNSLGDPSVPLAANAQDGYQRIRQKNDAWAVFGNLSYAVSPALKLRGGLRYTEDKKKLTVEAYEQSGFAPCVGPTLGIIPAPPKCTLAQLAGLEPDGDLSASPKDKKVNWDLSGTYALSKDINLYARAATGFRGSSVQSASAFNGKSVADAETNTSVEAGIKADLLDRRMRVNFGVFSYTVKDLQLTAVGGAANANILLNADKATGTGFELDMQALVTPNLLASLGVGYNDTKIKDSSLEVGGCGGGCTMTDPVGPNGGRLVNGNPLPQAPKTTVNFTLRYSQPTPTGEWYVLTDWVHRSKVNFFLYESREFTGKALTEEDVAALTAYPVVSAAARLLNAAEQDTFLQWLTCGASPLSACQKLGLSVTSFVKTSAFDMEFAERVQQVQSALSQVVAARLYRTAIDGNVSAQRYYLQLRPPPEWKQAPVAGVDLEELEPDELADEYRAAGTGCPD